MKEEILALAYSFRDIFSNFFVADIFDVFIITLFIYTLFILFKRAHSWPILAGMVVLMIIYAAALAFNLYLTSIVLQSFFAVFIVVLVVIFQQELRRFFEIISFWSTRQIKLQQEISFLPFNINELLQAVVHMSKEKTGALIVIQGKENIERFYEGGKKLDGLISEELLLSIFDPSSIGHDGALIINRDRVTKFGVHLPLSKNFKQIGKHGTRHSAALGITEHSDSISIVVSEERGTISSAYQGKLRELKDIEELEVMLKRFFKEMIPGDASSFWSDLIRRNSIAKLFSLSIALIFWFFFSFQAETIQRSFSFPITYRNVPANLFIEETSPAEVTVTLASRGQSAFDRLDERIVEIAVEAKDLEAGTNRIVLTERMVTHPPNFSVVEIVPAQIRLEAKEFRSVEIPIEAQLSGSVLTGFKVGKIEINPTVLTILVPEGASAPEKIYTEKIDIAGLQKDAIYTTKVILSKNMRFKDAINPNVTVRVIVSKK